MSEVIEIEADCPDCMNESRQARRYCKKHRGMCKGTGKVMKTVPKPEDPPRAETAWGPMVNRHAPTMGGY